MLNYPGIINSVSFGSFLFTHSLFSWFRNIFQFYYILQILSKGFFLIVMLWPNYPICVFSGFGNRHSPTNNYWQIIKLALLFDNFVRLSYINIKLGKVMWRCANPNSPWRIRFYKVQRHVNLQRIIRNLWFWFSSTRKVTNLFLIWLELLNCMSETLNIIEKSVVGRRSSLKGISFHYVAYIIIA